VNAPDSTVVILITTLAADADADVFARTLIDEQLAACVSVLPPMTSIYRWQGELEQAQERQLLIKTTAARVLALKERFQTLHPYDVPEFIVVRPEAVGELYAKWVSDSIG
jgi:periplasmic divalent cation tolerance protein